MTSEERAQRIASLLNIGLSRLKHERQLRESFNAVVQEIEEAEREAMQKHLCPPDLACKHCFSQGFRDAQEKAAEIAFDHNCDKDCDVDIKGGGGCAEQITERIRSMNPAEDDK